MSTPRSTNPQSYYLAGLTKITDKIAGQLGSADRIYRGEPETYDEEPYWGKVSSTLYRSAPVVSKSGKVPIRHLEQGILNQVRRYIPAYENKENFEIFTELQLYGNDTNLIDFTTDYRIALFFACNGFHDKDGRIILLKTTDKTKDKYNIRKPQSPKNRVLAQKSVFAQPSNGYINLEDITTLIVPSHLKQWILIHLWKFENISAQTIFNDLQGFIRHRNLNWSDGPKRPLYPADKTLSDMIASLPASIDERNQTVLPLINAYTAAIQYSPYDATIYANQALCYAKMLKIKRAVETVTKALYLKDDYAYAYMMRGGLYSLVNDHERSLMDYTSAISLNPNFLAKIYYYRGVEWLKLEKWDSAQSDLLTATERGYDIVDAFRHKGVKNFEQRYRVKLPQDIATMLQPEEPPQIQEDSVNG